MDMEIKLAQQVVDYDRTLAQFKRDTDELCVHIASLINYDHMKAVCIAARSAVWSSRSEVKSHLEKTMKPPVYSKLISIIFPSVGVHESLQSLLTQLIYNEHKYMNNSYSEWISDQQTWAHDLSGVTSLALANVELKCIHAYVPTYIIKAWKNSEADIYKHQCSKQYKLEILCVLTQIGLPKDLFKKIVTQSVVHEWEFTHIRTKCPNGTNPMVHNARMMVSAIQAAIKY